jgi:uncharacterized spore protein YtfJ
MAATPIIGPSVIGSAVTPITPGSDSIAASAYGVVFLVVRSVSTGTPTITVDDPTSQGPAGTGVSFNPDAQLTLTAGQTKVMRLDCARFRDANGNINYTTATPGDAVVYAIGVTP